MECTTSLTSALRRTVRDVHFCQPPNRIHHQTCTIEVDPMSAVWNDNVLAVSTELRELTLLVGTSRNRIVSRKNHKRNMRRQWKVEHFARALWKRGEVAGLREERFGLSPVCAHCNQQFRRKFCDFSHNPIDNFGGLSSEAAEDGLSGSRPAAGCKIDAEPNDTHATQNCTDPRKKHSADKDSSLIARWLRVFVGMKCINQHHGRDFVWKLRRVGAHDEPTE